MHLILCAEESEAELQVELAQSFPGVRAQTSHPLLFEVEAALSGSGPWPHLVFARQWLPDARPARSESIRGWAGVLGEAVAGVLRDDHPWALHVEPHYGVRQTHHIGARAWHSATRKGNPPPVAPRPEPGPPGVEAEAGRQRSRLIREAFLELLKKKRRHLLRRLRAEPARFTPNDSLVQLLLTAPDCGYLSLAPAPLPFDQRHLVSPFPKGEVPVVSDKSAPSRAFAKLAEAQRRLGRSIRVSETCVDLGASPGSWTWLALQHGARVVAIDRSPLRDDLMRDPRVEFQPGDAFRFQPPRPVDWLLCDILAAPERAADLLLEWARHGWCRQFVVTLKLGDAPGTEALTRLKRELAPLTREFFLTRLCANKKEVCAVGVLQPGGLEVPT